MSLSAHVGVSQFLNGEICMTFVSSFLFIVAYIVSVLDHMHVVQILRKHSSIVSNVASVIFLMLSWCCGDFDLWPLWLLGLGGQTEKPQQGSNLNRQHARRKKVTTTTVLIIINFDYFIWTLSVSDLLFYNVI